MQIKASASIRKNYNMLKLREDLLAVEEDRRAGRVGCTPDELEHYLDEVIDEVEHVKST